MESKSLSVANQREQEYGYRLAYKLACEQLAKVDIEEQCLKSGAKYQVIDFKEVIILEYLNRSYQITFPDIPSGPVQWGDGVVQVQQEGRMVSILACNNLDAILTKGRSFPGTKVESYPLTLKEIFLGHIRNC